LLSWHQVRTLKKLRATGLDWIPALPRISQKTWASLVTLGFVEEKREGEAANQRLLRLTEAPTVDLWLQVSSQSKPCQEISCRNTSSVARKRGLPG
jgi:hypothetical protein